MAEKLVVRKMGDGGWEKTTIFSEENTKCFSDS
jgi:hypothetical protein